MKHVAVLFICSLFVCISAAHADRSLKSPFLSEVNLNLNEEPLNLEGNLFFAQDSKSQRENTSKEISYKYKLFIGDLAALSLLLATPFTDGMSAPFASASYFLVSPLLHYFEPNNQDSGSKALMSLWYRVGIPTIGGGLAIGSLFLFPEDTASGLLTAYALGLGSIIGGIYGLYKDYSNAVKTQRGGADSANATLFNDPTAREVMMWQALMARDSQSPNVIAD